MRAKFIDIHAHLDMYKNIDQVLENAKKEGVMILTAGGNADTNNHILELREKYPQIKISLGLDPIEALNLTEKEINSEIRFITKNKDKIIAVGEVGLDLQESNELEKQKENLEKLVNLAKKLNLPLVVHSRKAEAEAIEFLEKLKAEKVIMHCFSGNMNLVKRIVMNGWKLSIPANIKHSEHFQNVVKEAPIESLFCETDSPFLHPEKLRENEPANVLESYKKIAEIKGLTLEEVKKKIWDNFEKVFSVQ
jgi:TatD DNase family protein